MVPASSVVVVQAQACSLQLCPFYRNILSELYLTSEALVLSELVTINLNLNLVPCDAQ